MYCRYLELRAEKPGREFFVADSGLFALGFLATGYRDDFFEQARADLLKVFGAVEDGAGVNVHVVVEAFEDVSVGRELEAGGGLAAVDTSAAGGEDADVASAANETGHADGIIPRRVHEAEPSFGDR